MDVPGAEHPSTRLLFFLVEQMYNKRSEDAMLLTAGMNAAGEGHRARCRQGAILL
ncbi:hypothetical protein [Labrys sp. WJW]|uniref:hypothetical protein n=1 Tax=Labrys sp. WJW TaxID=1737983 RepID=UPI0012E9D162|nr:hypothetical protein [Labrys sp. WJW]